MRIEATEVLWFEQHVLSLPELAELSGLPQARCSRSCWTAAPLPLDPRGPETRHTRPGRRTCAFWRRGAARGADRAPAAADFELDVAGLGGGVEPAGSGGGTRGAASRAAGATAAAGAIA
jgi:hypothetical protein